jgi:starvation-inducible outer membrane lipoprotein
MNWTSMKKLFFALLATLTLTLASCATTSESAQAERWAKAQAAYIAVLTTEKDACIVSVAAVQTGVLSHEKGAKVLEVERVAIIAGKAAFDLSAAPVSDGVIAALDNERIARESLEQALRSAP